jgi:hypothetical protein
MVLEHSIHRCPRSFHGILARKESAIALHGVAQEPFVGRLFSGLFF